jgi:rhamnosyltransferase
VEQVCAIVVTFQPDALVCENLQKLHAQVARLVVIDNGSAAGQLQQLYEAQARIGFELIANDQNLGIATALNQGVRFALAAGAPWLLLSDQDSQVTDDFVRRMLTCFRQCAAANRPAILVPRYVDQRFGSVLVPPGGGADGLEAATTSGSLLPAHIFAEAGLFWDDLFIDGVDYEYSLRVRALGYQIHECPEAILLHSPGTPTYHRLPGLQKKVQTANYSPTRRYYQERNKILVARRYWPRFAPFLLGQFVISAKDLAKIVLFEDRKGEKLQYFFRGIADGVRGRAGKLPGS